MRTQIDTSGLDNIRKKFQDLSGSVAVEDILTDAFISKNTNFPSLQAMVDAGGFDSLGFEETQEWANFATENSRFQSWQEMAETATKEYVERKLK